MKVLFIINDRPYGTERVYNALGRAHAFATKEPPTLDEVAAAADEADKVLVV